MGNTLFWFRWFNPLPPPPAPYDNGCDNSPSPPPKPRAAMTNIEEISDESDDYSSCEEECIEM